MKKFFVIALMSSLLVNICFAAETSTECPMMREQNERNNPKANLSSVKKPSQQGKTRGSLQ